MGSRRLGPLFLVAARRLLLDLCESRVLAFGLVIFGSTGPAPSQTVLLEVSENIPGFGWHSAGVGDVDGDGTPDVLVGAHAYSTPTLSVAGRARVYSGSTGSVLLEWVGTQANAYLGRNPARGGDWNGDGVPDVLFTSYVPMVQTTIHVMSGADGSQIRALPGDVSAAIGDTNGDGVEETLVGYFAYQPPGVPGSPWGQATLYDGATGGTLFSMTGPGSASYLGWDVDGLGDVSGDGVPDVVVSAYCCPAFIPHISWVQVLSGTNGSPVYVFPTLQVESEFGRSVAGLGDLNGDGAGEIAIGIPRWSFGVSPNTGRVVVYSGGTGTLLYSLVGWTVNEYLGVSVSKVGDVDGDGRPDLVAGATIEGFGPVLGRVQVYSGRTGEVIFRIQDIPPLGSLGFNVSWVGDVNGDGFSDFLASRHLGTPPSFRVYSGAPAGLTPFGSACATPSGWVPRIGAARMVLPSGIPPLRLHLSNVPPGSGGFLLLGLTNTQWWGVPLPLDLAFLGLPGCALLVSPDLAFPAVATGSGALAGHASLTFPVPVTPSTLGASTYFQWFTADPSDLPASTALTRALEFVIQ